MTEKLNHASVERYICKRCNREINNTEKYLFFGYYYCRECKHTLETDSWFQEFVKDKRFREIEN